MTHQVKFFIELFTPLFKKGLPLFWEEKGSMFSKKEYHDRLVNCRLDNRKFEYMQQYLYGKIIIDKLSYDFKMMFAFIATCAQLPYFSYMEHVELRVLGKEMASLQFPNFDQWKTIEKYGKKI